MCCRDPESVKVQITLKNRYFLQLKFTMNIFSLKGDYMLYINNTFYYTKPSHCIFLHNLVKLKRLRY